MPAVFSQIRAVSETIELDRLRAISDALNCTVDYDQTPILVAIFENAHRAAAVPQCLAWEKGQVHKCGQSPTRLSIFRGSPSTFQTDIEIAEHLIDSTFPYSSLNWVRLGNR